MWQVVLPIARPRLLSELQSFGFPPSQHPRSPGFKAEGHTHTSARQVAAGSCSKQIKAGDGVIRVHFHMQKKTLNPPLFFRETIWEELRDSASHVCAPQLLFGLGQGIGEGLLNPL